MKLLSDKTQNSIQAKMGAFSENKYIKSVSNGMIFIMTPIIVGSLFTLLANFPVSAYTDFINAHGITEILNIPIDFTTNIMAVLAVFAIAYNLAYQFKEDGVMAGILALICFFIVTPLSKIKINNVATDFISFDWLGAKGLFVAILIGLLTARVYVFCQKKGFSIKMPDSVPPAVSKSFNALIPGFVTSILALVVASIFKLTPFGSLDQFIYTLVQTPLQGLSNSYGAMMVVTFAVGFLWFFGLHGSNIVLQGIMMPLYLSLDMQNMAAYQAGKPLPNIIGWQFFVCYVIFSGAGVTIGLTLLMAFRAKSQQYKMLGRLALPTAIFNINEPITFGTPVVLNPVIGPFYILTPLITATIAYVATAIGLVPRLSGVQIPWPTPIIFSGILEGSWRIAVLQVVLVIVSVAIYSIPFKKLEKKAYETENRGEDTAA
ncbi:PTS sugar transporter subunit IIC [Caproicibacter sp. BJN0012]|uniref:PTS sugar transporter subunit IIC n=1 Tax=Caproicibacter sp. BJN0012 TaxID=3110227 RepID=UPI002E119049|nr:PTS transporter subunit EIIC [Caproicibacter sp. BJN0012]